MTDSDFLMEGWSGASDGVPASETPIEKMSADMLERRLLDLLLYENLFEGRNASDPMIARVAGELKTRIDNGNISFLERHDISFMAGQVESALGLSDVPGPEYVKFSGENRQSLEALKSSADQLLAKMLPDQPQMNP